MGSLAQLFLAFWHLAFGASLLTQNPKSKNPPGISIHFPPSITQWVSIPGDPAFTPGASGITLSAWFTTPESATQATIIETFNTTQTDGTQSGFQFNLGGECTINVSNCPGSNGSQVPQRLCLLVGDHNATPTYQFMVCDTGTLITSNRWWHVAVSYASGTVTFYTNGTFSSSATPATINVAASGSNLSIGASPDNAQFGIADYFPWNGNISNVSLWTGALSPSDIANLYNGSAPPYITTTPAFSGILSNLVGWWQLGPGADTLLSWVDSSGNGHTGTTQGSHIAVTNSYP